MPSWLRAALLCLATASMCGAQDRDLTQLSLDDLANVQVTSASRKPENLSRAPAAIYVLTAHAIREGGFMSLPDALRTVPGLYVAQTDDHIWQISARGFSDLNNNKMLVLVDGRSVYTPLYGGVYWDALDIPLESIDRVEVIRGPGGTLWGANAVNGVINIVTKSARQARGAMISASIDTELGYTTTVRYGAALGTANYYIFGRTAYWEPFEAPGESNLPNRLLMPQAGLRADWAVTQKDSLTVEGGSYDGRVRSVDFPFFAAQTTPLKGSNALLRWKHSFSERSNVETVAYCDWYSRYQVPGESRNTCDVEVQHDYEPGTRSSLIWGGAFNSTGNDISPNAFFFQQLRRRVDVESGFLQYGFAVVPERLRVVAGTKLEHNGYTGFEYQPQIRAVWTPISAHSFWTSISRAVRVPSRGEEDLSLDITVPFAGPGGEPVVLDIDGNNSLGSEHLRAYEAGYRFEKAAFTFDLSTFYNDYKSRIVQELSVSQTMNALQLQYLYVNQGSAQSHGAEMAAQWRPIRRWTLSGGVTETRGSPDALEATPRHLFNIQSQFSATRKLNINTTLYHYGAVPLGRLADYPTVPLQSVSEFHSVDAGGLYRLLPQWSFGIWGRNLQSPRHIETRDTIFGNHAGEIPRSLTFQLMWQSNPEVN